MPAQEEQITFNPVVPPVSRFSPISMFACVVYVIFFFFSFQRFFSGSPPSPSSLVSPCCLLLLPCSRAWFTLYVFFCSIFCFFCCGSGPVLLLHRVRERVRTPHHGGSLQGVPLRRRNHLGDERRSHAGTVGVPGKFLTKQKSYEGFVWAGYE